MSERHDDLTALRRAFAALPAVPPDPAACPPSERLLAAVAGELPPAELRDLVEHVAACPACAEDWRLAAALGQPVGEAPEAAYSPVTVSGPRRTTLWWAAAAASVLLAVGLIPGHHQTPRAMLRGTQAGPVLSAPEILPREHCVLRWSAIPGATYDVDVSTESGQTVERVVGLAGTQSLVSPALLADLPAGTELTWRVTAHLSGGRHLSSSKGKFILR